VLGILTVETLRSLLLIEEVGTRTSAPRTYGSHFFLTFQQNLDMTIAAGRHSSQHISLVVPILVVVAIYLIARVAMVRPTEFLGAALMSLAQIAAILLVGVAYETRVFLYLIPFLCVGAVLLFDAKVKRDSPLDLMNRPVSPAKSSSHVE
jgi:hypothetical protein